MSVCRHKTGPAFGRLGWKVIISLQNLNNIILPQIQPHDVIVHEIAVSDRIVALPELTHAQVLIEVQRLIVAVDMQFHTAGLRMTLADPLKNTVKEETAYVLPLTFGQHIDFLQVENIQSVLALIAVRRIKRLHRHIAHGLPVDLSNKISMVFLGHLLPETVRRVHHIHHIIALLRCNDIFIGRRKRYISYRLNNRNVL